MNTPLMHARTTLSTLGQAGQTLWRSRSPRERLGLTLAASLIALALLWQIGLAPALRTWQEAPTRQATLDAQRERLLQLQQQAQALQALPRVGQEEALRWLQGPAIEALGPGAQVRVQGDQVQVQLQAASPEGLTRWLRQAREQARALPQQVQLQQAALPTAPGPASATSVASPSSSAALKSPAASRPTGAAVATGGLVWKGSLVLKLS